MADTFAQRVAALPVAPLLWYRMDEASGATAINAGSLGTTWNATYFNGPVVVTPGPGFDSVRARDFNGSNQFLDRTQGAAIDAAQFTVAAVFKADQNRTLRDEIIGKLGEYEVYVTPGNSGGTLPRYIEMRVNVAGLWRTMTCTSTNPIVHGRVYMVFASYNAAQMQVHLCWLNGADIVIEQFTQPQSGARALGGTAWRMGALAPNYYDGVLDEGMLFNYVLTYEQVEDLAQFKFAPIDKVAAPGPFTVPVATTYLIGDMVNVAFGAAPGGGPYRIQMQRDGGLWSNVVTDLADPAYPWQNPDLIGGAYRLRVRVDTGAVISDWIYSPTFTMQLDQSAVRTFTQQVSILPTKPPVWFRMDEASGAAAVNSGTQGIAIAGTYFNGPVAVVEPGLAFDSLRARAFNGVNQFVDVPTHAAFNTQQFSIFAVFNVDLLRNKREEIIGKLQEYQIYVQQSAFGRTLHMDLVTPAGTFQLDTAHVVVAGRTYVCIGKWNQAVLTLHLYYREVDGTIWTEKRTVAAVSATRSMPGQAFRLGATVSGTADFVDATLDEGMFLGYELTDQQALNLAQFKLAPDMVPVAPPGPFTSPTGVFVVGDPITIAFGFSLVGGPYRLQRSINGGPYADFGALLLTTSTVWDSTDAAPATYRWRVRSEASGGAPSVWVESAEITLNAPALEIEDFVAWVTEYSVLLSIPNSGQDETRFRIQVVGGDLEAPLAEKTVIDAASRHEAWIYSLFPNADYVAQFSVDEGATWSTAQRFTTLNISEFGQHFARDEKNHVRGLYGMTPLPVIHGPLENGIPEMPAREIVNNVEFYGVRFNRMRPGNYLQEGWMATRQVCRLDARKLHNSGAGESRTTAPWTMMCAFIPYDLTDLMDIMGSAGPAFQLYPGGEAHTVWQPWNRHFAALPQDNENLFQFRPLATSVDWWKPGLTATSAGLRGGPFITTKVTERPWVDPGDPAIEGAINTAWFGVEQPWYGWNVASSPYGCTDSNGNQMMGSYPVFFLEYMAPHNIDGYVKHGINGTWLDAIWPGKAGTLAFQNRMMRKDDPCNPDNITSQFPMGMVHSQDWFDIGHGTSASHSYAKALFCAFVYWRHMLSAVQVAAVHEAALSGSEALHTYLAQMDPQPYVHLRFAEYPRPTKPLLRK